MEIDRMEPRARTLLVKNAQVLVTMDGARREIRDGGMFIEGNRIVAVGATEDLPATADEVLDMRGHLVTPGLVNTHHHMYQSLTRAIPAAQNAELFGWLTNLYKIWANLTPEMIAVSTQTAMAELLLSGCTTSSDHLYIYPNGSRLDDSIAAAREIGMRFHAARGSMSVGQKDGGLPPDSVVEKEDAILKDTQRVIETYNDEGRYAMLRVVVAPCSPFSVSRELMRDSALLARQYGVSMHTHLAENVNDVAYSREKFGMKPAEYAEDLGWVGMTCGMRTACNWTARASTCSRAPGRASRIVRVRTCGSPPASHRSARCAMRVCRWESASMARRRTTAPRWSARCARRSCCSGSASGRMR
jgi:cytosine/adenosine deaminase-related metal-dependent hydrolase